MSEYVNNVEYAIKAMDGMKNVAQRAAKEVEDALNAISLQEFVETISDMAYSMEVLASVLHNQSDTSMVYEQAALAISGLSLACDLFDGEKVLSFFANGAQTIGKTTAALVANSAEWIKNTGDIFNDIVGGVGEFFIGVVNGLIDGINAVVAVPFNGINFALGLIKGIEIFGARPFAGLGLINVPQIPKLAQGAVLPANRPFLAVVGDQRHGTNVEAPLGVIQEAVALELANLNQSNLAGHEATVAVLRQILEAVLGIDIGDDVIGRAAGRYNAAMAVMRGGRN